MPKAYIIKRILIFLSVVSFGTYFAYNYLIPKGEAVPAEFKYTDVYPITIDQAKQNITSPVKFSLDTVIMEWVMYGYQGLIALYMLLTFFRSESLGILPNWFYIFWSFACLSEMGFTTLLLRQHFLGGFLLLALATIFRHAALGFAFYGLQKYLGYSMEPNMFDVWSIRLLVQNGLLFRQAWTSFILTIQVAFILHGKFFVDSLVSSYASLSMLAVILIVWFIMQNFVIESFTRFTFVEYISLAFPLVGILLQTKEDYGVGHLYFKFSIGLLALDGFLLLVRIAFMYNNERKQIAVTGETAEKIEM